jgi:thiamine pyrophosphokinase
VGQVTKVAVVVGGGGLPAVGPGDLGDVGPSVRVVAADSGLEGALALGLVVDVVVGDMDSVDPVQLEKAARDGVDVERHHVAKDATDLDLAIDRALDAGPGRLVVVTGTGDRFDHALGVVTNLAAPDRPAIPVEAFIGPAHVWVIRDEARLVGEPGALVSLVPMHGPAHGVRTTGLAYPLDDEDLAPGTTRGISNEWAAPVATVSVRDGILVAVAP